MISSETWVNSSGAMLLRQCALCNWRSELQISNIWIWASRGTTHNVVWFRFITNLTMGGQGGGGGVIVRWVPTTYFWDLQTTQSTYTNFSAVWPTFELKHCWPNRSVAVASVFFTLQNYSSILNWLLKFCDCCRRILGRYLYLLGY